jgi:serine/threonine protein kinase
VRPRSQVERASQASAPYPPQHACPPFGWVDDANEKTATDSAYLRARLAVVRSFGDPGDTGDTGEKTTVDLVDAGAGLPLVRRFDDPDEKTAIDPVEPDNEPTALRPPITPPCPATAAAPDAAAMPPSEAPRRTRFARGSSQGFNPGSLGHIGKYELREKLGRGAFGVVFSAHDPSLDRAVAIKVLRPTHLTNQEIVQRFLQEARTTARIAHPGIVTIHDCGQVETNLGATAFIAMELLTGESLARRLTHSGRLLPEAAIEIARQIASALEAAHRVDVLHRDLKPDNLHLVPDPAMPSGERVKILDFGLAKLGREGHTQLQTVFGTPRYMSPEQGRSATQIDHRSDIYSLGCILFELVTGRLPFEGDTRQLIERHQWVLPPRAQTFAPDLPPALDDLIADMLAKDPMERPQTMGAVQRALQDIGGGRAAAAEVIPLLPSDWLAPIPEPQGPPMPFDRPAARRPSEPPIPRRPSEPPVRFDPPERLDVWRPADTSVLSGEVLVPAVAAAPRVGPPVAPLPAPVQAGRPSQLTGWGGVGLLALALVLIVILASI